jgi:DNA helicase-2/ATP-dependent DNA helicase PcrA
MTNTFIPSTQQAAVFDWIVNGSGSAFVEAVAGAGKTTTLIEACKLLKGGIAFVAFNKKIVDEIKDRLARLGLPNIDAATFHSLGFKAWRKVYPGVKVDDKAKQQRLIDVVGIPEALQGFVFKIISHAKNRAMTEAQISNLTLWYNIVDHFDMLEDLEDEGMIELAIELSQKTLKASIDLSKTLINFDDMIYMPVIKGCRVWQYDWVLTDEAQDTNELRRQFARKLLKAGGRSIWVGDRFQSIYGFTGADADAVERIVSEFNCTLLPLNVTYRCPKVVVAKARALGSAFTITAHASAPEGILRTIKQADLIAQDLKNEDAILCRKTAPLVEQAFALIKKGIACHVEGRDIGAGLLKLATRYKVKSVHGLVDKLRDYKERETQKLIAKGKETMAEALADRVDTLLVLADGCETIDCIKQKILSLFQDTDGNRKSTLTLATVHRSKGREWNRVFILGYNQFMPSKAARQEWQRVQETNLQYVAITRSKKELVLVDVEVVQKAA